MSESLTQAEAAMFATAAAYERYMGRWSRLLAPDYLLFAGVADGQRVLDVGTGIGSLAFALEARLPSVRIVGVDVSASFIAHANRNRSARASFEVGDAQALRFEDGSFDHAMALLVLNFVPGHDKAVGEMRRVVRPGGVVSACVWDYDAGMQMLRVFWDEVVTLDPTAAAKDERNMKLCRRGQLAQLWREKGMIRVEEKALEIGQHFASFDDYWAPFLKGAGPGGAYVASLGEDQRVRLEARLRNRLLGRGDGSITLQARAWCVKGQVP
jgi:SAM-dependent methyltransferase